MFKIVVLVICLALAPDLRDEDNAYRQWLREHVGLDKPEVSSTSPSTYRWKEPVASSSTPAVEIPGEAAVDGPGRQQPAVGILAIKILLVLAVLGGIAVGVLCVYQSDLFGRFQSQGLFDFDTVFNHQKFIENVYFNQ